MKTKSRLGKGLDALISTSIDHISPQLNKTVHEVDVNLVDPNPFQPRMEMDEAAFEELKRSVKERGIIQPVAVRPGKNGRYELIAGERRLRAAIAVGLKKIPAYILNVTEEVAEKIGKDRATVANLIRLLKLPDIIQESLKKGEIREGHARALLGLPDKRQQIDLWKKTVKNGLSVRKVEEAVKKIRKTTPALSVEHLPRKKPAYIGRIEATLREKFGTQVKIRTKKEGGSIEIIYYSREDLERLMELFDDIKI